MVMSGSCGSQIGDIQIWKTCRGVRNPQVGGQAGFGPIQSRAPKQRRGHFRAMYHGRS